MTDKPSKQNFTGFSQTVIDHARNPRNMGAIPHSDGYATGTGSCSDTMEIWLRMRDNVILDIAFSTNGCGPTIATLSFVTELVKGKTIAEALHITPESVLEALGGLPEENLECASLSVTVLKAAIRDYFAFKNEPWKKLYRPQH